MSDPPRDRIECGEFTIVHRRDLLEHLDERAATRLVERLLRDNPQASSALIALAQETSYGFPLTLPEACRVVADAIARGYIVPIVERPSPRLMSAAADPVDLRDLRDHPDDDRRLPDRPAPQIPRDPIVPDPQTPAPRTDDVFPPGPDNPKDLTWVKFEIFDRRGRSADGRFEVILDGVVSEGSLGQSVQEFDELRSRDNVTLRVTELSWPDSEQPEAAGEPS